MVREPPLATSAEVAGYLSVAVKTLDYWAYTGRGPAFVKVGQRRRYRWADVEDYLNGRAGGGSSQTAADVARTAREQAGHGTPVAAARPGR